MVRTCAALWDVGYYEVRPVRNCGFVPDKAYSRGFDRSTIITRKVTSTLPIPRRTLRMTKVGQRKTFRRRTSFIKASL